MIPLPAWWTVESGWGWLTRSIPAGPLELVFAAVLGLMFGSFLNVLIYRLPRKESIIWPGSHCTSCDHKLPPWENVPVLSYLVLRGRCRACGTTIPWRYPAVEAVAGGLTAGLVGWLGLGLATIGAVFFTLALFAVAWIDAEHRVIPNEISLALFVLGMTVRGFTFEGLSVAFLGALLGFGALLAVGWGYRIVRGRDGLGGGDVKLAAGLGAFLGPPGVLLTLMLAAAAGAAVGIGLIATQRGDRMTAIPFGTVLAPVAVLVMIAGPAIWRGYLGLAGVPAP